MRGARRSPTARPAMSSTGFVCAVDRAILPNAGLFWSATRTGRACRFCAVNTGNPGGFSDPVRLEHLVTHVVIHEVGHHFGLSDDDMHALEDGAD